MFYSTKFGLLPALLLLMATPAVARDLRISLGSGQITQSQETRMSSGSAGDGTSLLEQDITYMKLHLDLCGASGFCIGMKYNQSRYAITYRVTFEDADETAEEKVLVTETLTSIGVGFLTDGGFYAGIAPILAWTEDDSSEQGVILAPDVEKTGWLMDLNYTRMMGPVGLGLFVEVQFITEVRSLDFAGSSYEETTITRDLLPYLGLTLQL